MYLQTNIDVWTSCSACNASCVCLSAKNRFVVICMYVRMIRIRVPTSMIFSRFVAFVLLVVKDLFVICCWQ